MNNWGHKGLFILTRNLFNHILYYYTFIMCDNGWVYSNSWQKEQNKQTEVLDD